jgi:hypothetical protein
MNKSIFAGLVPGRSGHRRPRRDRQARRTGANVILLLILSFIAAIVVARSCKLGIANTVISLIVGGGAPAGLYMTWEGLRQSSRPADEPATVVDDADQFAAIVREQWEKEYEVRNFNDPTRQLTVSWAAAGPALTVRWDELVEAALGLGWHKGTCASAWASGPQGITGLEDQLPAVLGRVPTGWLVVLGGPGYGKSMLLLRLVLDMVKQRGSGEPVPVFVPMTTWDAEHDSLREWLEKQLPIDYPGLGTLVSSGEGESSRIAALLAEQKIVPVLDGLDEVPPRARAAALHRLNEAFASPARPLRLVLTSRTGEYQEVVGRPGERWTPLRCAAVVELHPLDADMVAAYLGERGDDPRWIPVIEELKQPRTALAEALRTPLYVSLTSAIYNPQLDDPCGQPPDPADLRKFRDVESIKEHLLDMFIPAAYPAERRKAEQAAKEDGEDSGLLPAERWLMFLAGYLTNGKEFTTGLQWWKLQGLAPRWLAPALVGIACGIGSGFAAATGTHVGTGIGIGFGTGMLIALAIGVSAFYARRRWDRGRLDGTAYRKRYGRRRPGPGMAGGLIGAVVGGLAAGVAGMHFHVGHETSLYAGLPEALGIGLGAGASGEFFGGLAGGLVGSFVAGCLAAVGPGLPAGLVNGLGVGLAAGLAAGYLGRQAPSRRRPKWEAHIGVPGGLVVGAVTGLIASRESPIAGVVAGVVLAATAAVPFGLRHFDQDMTAVPSPGEALARDATAFRLTALSAGLAAGSFGFIGGSLTSIFEVGAKASLPDVVGDGLGIGLSSALVVGLAFGFYHAASPEFRIIHWWLALQGKAPWRLQHFLEDAHHRSVLRQSGATYEFRHEVLQRRLANRLKAGQQRGTAGSRPAGKEADQRSAGPEALVSPSQAITSTP